jgi:putative peptide zinc metalloprotease protein
MSSPFSPLGPSSLEAFADRVERRALPAGATALAQGMDAQECLLLLAGSAEVFADEDDGVRRRLASVYPGGLVGEAALLGGGVYDATVECAGPSSWLVIDRDALLDAMRSDRREVVAIAELVELAGRPRRKPGVELHTVMSRHGETVAVLKDPERSAYNRLSAQGGLLWEQMDGHHTVKDLTLDLFERFGRFEPQVVAGTVASLAAAGFVLGVSLPPSVLAGMPGLSARERGLAWARRALEAKLVFSNVDRVLLPLWRAGVRWLFTRIALSTLAAVAIAGLVTFGTEVGRSSHHAPALALVIGLGLGYVLSVLLHEAGHAFTTIRFGREIKRAGVGWYWFGPVAFVDTSDMWLASRGQRIAVTVAGPAVQLVVGGVLALAALPVGSGGAKAILLELALFNYASVLLNLNPLLEYDGYYALMDYLDRPSLRRDCLRWLRTGLPGAIKGRSLRGHWLELCYGLASLLYVGTMAVVTILVYRLVLQHEVATIIPSGLAAALGWAVALLVAALATAGAIQDTRSA